MKVVCIMGPTAVGKSELAVAASLKFDGEIVNADSMQVFQRLDIGTGMPDAAMFGAVPHHLFAYLAPDLEPDAGRWSGDAARVIRGIHQRHRTPFVVGGTFFWIRALFEGLSSIPRVSVEVRDKVLKLHSRKGARAMHDMLADVDPDSAVRIAPGDTQRVLRALEVYEATGVPISRFQREAPAPAIDAPHLKIALTLPREVLYGKINRRVVKMVESGLVEEVRSLLEDGYPETIRPLSTGSYLPVVRHVKGEIDLDRMVEDVATSHRRYSKRQMTWLRGEPDVVAIDRTDENAFFETISDFLA